MTEPQPPQSFLYRRPLLGLLLIDLGVTLVSDLLALPGLLVSENLLVLTFLNAALALPFAAWLARKLGLWSDLGLGGRNLLAAFKRGWPYLLGVVSLTLFYYLSGMLTWGNFRPRLSGASAVVLLALLPMALMEEALCRGLLINLGLRSRWAGEPRGVYWIVAVPALLFALGHIPADLSRGYGYGAYLARFCWLCGTALFLGEVYLRRRNLWAVTLLHYLNNTLDAVPQLLQGEEITIPQYTGGAYVQPTPGELVLLGLIGLALGIWGLVRCRTYEAAQQVATQRLRDSTGS